MGTKQRPLSEQEMQFLKVLPMDGSAIHVLQAAPDLQISLNGGRALAAELAAMSYVQFESDMVRLAPAGAAMMLH